MHCKLPTTRSLRICFVCIQNSGNKASRGSDGSHPDEKAANAYSHKYVVVRYTYSVEIHWKILVLLSNCNLQLAPHEQINEERLSETQVTHFD